MVYRSKLDISLASIYNPDIYREQIIDVRIPVAFEIYLVDLRPNLPAIGRKDVGFVIYQNKKALMRVVGTTPEKYEQAILCSLRLEQNLKYDILQEILGY